MEVFIRIQWSALGKYHHGQQDSQAASKRNCILPGSISTFWREGKSLHISWLWCRPHDYKHCDKLICTLTVVNFTANKLYLNKVDFQKKKKERKETTLLLFSRDVLCLTTQNQKHTGVRDEVWLSCHSGKSCASYSNTALCGHIGIWWLGIWQLFCGQKVILLRREQGT